MTDQSPVFKKTYKDYMAQVARLDLKFVEQKLGVQVEGDEVVIPLLRVHAKKLTLTSMSLT
ncbi:MAG: hypothetical protein GY864_05390 [Desulfobacterales bacterium]|nr:hypothetical protein [Desulfobacterales bacterium]